jgi:hypothetical protein
MIHKLKVYTAGIFGAIIAMAMVVSVALPTKQADARGASVNVGVTIEGPQAIVVTSPADGTETSDPNITIEGNYGKEAVKVEVVVNGEVVDTIMIKDPGETGGKISFPYKFAKYGDYEITLRAYNEEGEMYSYDFVKVTYFQKILPDIPGVPPTGILRIGSSAIAGSDIIGFSALFIVALGIALIITRQRSHQKAHVRIRARNASQYHH